LDTILPASSSAATASGYEPNELSLSRSGRAPDAAAAAAPAEVSPTQHHHHTAAAEAEVKHLIQSSHQRNGAVNVYDGFGTPSSAGANPWVKPNAKGKRLSNGKRLRYYYAEPVPAAACVSLFIALLRALHVLWVCAAAALGGVDSDEQQLRGAMSALAISDDTAAAAKPAAAAPLAQFRPPPARYPGASAPAPAPASGPAPVAAAPTRHVESKSQPLSAAPAVDIAEFLPVCTYLCWGCATEFACCLLLTFLSLGVCFDRPSIGAMQRRSGPLSGEAGDDLSGMSLTLDPEAIREALDGTHKRMIKLLANRLAELKNLRMSCRLARVTDRAVCVPCGF
jgi:hypothetical protein